MAHVRPAGLLAAAALVIVAGVLAIVGGGGERSPEAVDTRPRFVGVDELGDLEETLGHPVYWVGERPPARLELKQEADGSVFLRYLPSDAVVGESPASFLTVGTYPVLGALEATRRAAEADGAKIEPIGDGGIAFENSSRRSAYFAYPGTDLQIEVYAPKPRRALELIRAGAVEPVGG